MQVTKLRMVVDESAKDLQEEGAQQVDGYYFHDNVWWETSTHSTVTGSLSAELNQCLRVNIPSRLKKSLSVNFPLKEMQAIIRGKFKGALKQNTIEAMQRVVLRSYRNASNEYAVKYNPMTGLLGKQSFHDLVARQLTALSAEASLNPEPKAEQSIPQALCLLALDIDHFKQVNDSYGHSYGDLVIKSFAIRIESTVKKFCETNESQLSATCAHVSGEEFFCLAWGSVATTTFDDLASTILKSVSEQSLPSDSELKLLTKSATNTDLDIPPQANRKITCSIGGIVAGIPTSPDNQISASRFIHQSDLALIKSKSQGRDRVTFFPAILQIGGRVLDYNADLRICIIDTGSEIGVTRGQEFLVYHPSFTGGKPYILDDGRSKKVMGRFPKVPLCRITTFEVQHNISFCKISEPSTLETEIPTNATLEAIPLGTLAISTSSYYLPTSDESLTPNLGTIAETEKRISQKIEPASKVSFVVVGIRNENQLLSDHGSAAVNRCLTVACRHLDKLSGKEFLGQIDTTRLLLQLKSFNKTRNEELDKILEAAEEATGARAKFVAGVYSPDSKGSEKELPMPLIPNLKDRVDLARYAASPEGMFENIRIHEFTFDSAQFVLARLSKLREFKRGLADYERFTKIGISGPGLDNLAGVLAYSIDDTKLAETCFLKAISASPGDMIIYRLNAVTAQVSQGDFNSAIRTADSIDKDVLEKNYKDHAFGVTNLALAYAEVAIRSNIEDDLRRAELWISRALELEKSQAYRERLVSLRQQLTTSL